MFKKRLTPFTCIILALIVAAGTFVATSSALSVKHKAELNQERLEGAKYNDYVNLITAMGEDSGKYEKLSQMVAMIEGYYIRDYDEDALWENLYKSLTETLGDDYSYYLTADDYNALIDSGSGNFVGIGVHAVRDSETYGIYIYGVFPDSPAEKAGIQKGDIVMAANGINAEKDNYYDLLDTIKGEAGSELELSLKRGEELINVTVKREAVDSENVIYEKLDGNIAYMRIISFADETMAEEFSAKVNKAQKDGCDKFVFDVRNNSGGYLEAICDTLDLLLPEGPIINIVDKKGSISTQSSDADCIDGEFTVLCNGSTASAAELFTAALRDYELATIIGETTFGKGTMQTTRVLPDGSGLKLSTAYYNPPKNVSYDGIGIKPDYEIKLKEEWTDKFYQMPKEEDLQLLKAIEVLNSAS